MACHTGIGHNRQIIKSSMDMLRFLSMLDNFSMTLE